MAFPLHQQVHLLIFELPCDPQYISHSTVNVLETSQYSAKVCRLGARWHVIVISCLQGLYGIYQSKSNFYSSQSGSKSNFSAARMTYCSTVVGMDLPLQLKEAVSPEFCLESGVFVLYCSAPQNLIVKLANSIRMSARKTIQACSARFVFWLCNLVMVWCFWVCTIMAGSELG